MNKKPKNESKKRLAFLRSKKFFALVTPIFGIILVLIALQVFFWNRIYPAITVSRVSVGTLTPEVAHQKIEFTLESRLKTPIQLIQNQTASNPLAKFDINLNNTIQSLNSQEAVEEALQYGHTKLYKPPTDIPLTVIFNDQLGQQLDQIERVVNQNPINAQIKVDGDQINVSPSEEGYVLDRAALIKRLTDYINSGFLVSEALPMKKAYPNLSYSSALSIKKRLDQIKQNPLKLTFKDQTFPIDISTTLSLIDLQNNQASLLSTTIQDHPINLESVVVGKNEYVDTKLSLNQEKLTTFLQTIAPSINQTVEEPLFEFDPSSTTRIKQFRPPQEGQVLDLVKSAQSLESALLTENQTEVPLAVNLIEPKNQLTNELGIKELIAEGASDFTHSIPNRIFNLTLAASRINGVLIPPNESFSFVGSVGDISAASGYKQGYIIKSGRTVLDDGGGVCQVSTTVFRAALNAGLPITERTAHAYRVGYYENDSPPGLDATIFSPSVDFKFKNDTGHHILVQTRVEGLKLYVDFYGTSDGRKSVISKPVILSQTPPLPEIRQDDPTLPKGEIKQVDFPAWGANVVFTRTVSRNGQTLINETYRSNYRPWQAVFLVGTKT